MILERIGAALQDLYRIDVAPPIHECLISQPVFAQYCEQRDDLDLASQETLLIETDADGCALGLYIAPDILEHLRAHDPMVCLDLQNLEATCIAIEGMSHLYCAWWKLHHGQNVSLLELELQAEVDKYLLCNRWIRKQGGETAPLLRQLFHHYSLQGGMDQEAAHRYHRASRLAWVFCDEVQRRQWAPQAMPALVRHVRQFYRLSHWQKLRAISPST
jgi:hypothetical protein